MTGLWSLWDSVILKVENTEMRGYKVIRKLLLSALSNSEPLDSTHTIGVLGREKQPLLT